MADATKRVAPVVSIANADTATATFTESAALDSTHLLVALVYFSGSSNEFASNSWGVTPMAGSANYGSGTYLGALAVRGNGTINSLTVNLTSAKGLVKIILMAFEGFTTLTPESASGSALTAVTSRTLTAANPVANPNRVAIAAVATVASMGAITGEWSNGFAALPFTDRLLAATNAYTAAGPAPSTTTPTWATARDTRGGVWVLEGKAPAPVADTTAPVVNITSPAANSTVRGTIDLVATATDNSGAAPIVQFFMGSTLLGSGTRNGTTYTLAGVDTTQVESRAYSLRAVATDAAGNAATVENTVIVDNSTASTSTPPGLYYAGKLLTLPVGIERLYLGESRLLGSSPTLPPPTGGGGVVTPPPTGAPTRLASFGPNGTHYAPRTPWIGAPNSAWDSTEEVECTWPAIAAAIQRATTNFPNGKCRIFVRPGTLGGFGGGSSSTPVLQNLGALGRPWRIAVAPRDGVFSVKHDSSFRFNNIKGVSFIGFTPSGADHVEASGGTDTTGANTSPNALSLRGLNFSNSADCAFGWSKLTHFNLTANNGGNIDGIDLFELISPDNVISNNDRSSGRNADGGYMRNVTFQGLWQGARWRSDASAHLDTFQASGNSGRFQDFVWLDAYINGVSNAVIIGVGDGVEPVNAMTNPFIDHCALVGGLQAANHMYPFPNGAPSAGQAAAVAMQTGPVALNGKPYKPRVRDSLISGKVVWTFDKLENTKVRSNDIPTPTSGTPIIEAGLFTTEDSFKSYGINRVPLVADMRSWWAY